MYDEMPVLCMFACFFLSLQYSTASVILPCSYHFRSQPFQHLLKCFRYPLIMLCFSNSKLHVVSVLEISNWVRKCIKIGKVTEKIH
jgi:hypothetical protein